MAKWTISKVIDIMNIDINIRDIFKMNLHTENIEFAKQPEWNKLSCKNAPLKDIDLSQLKYYLNKIHEIDISDKLLIDVCLNIALQNQYNPIKDDLTKEKWDGKPRISTWLINAVNCENNHYTRLVSERFLIATLKRVYEPGQKFDHMLILEGKQGIGKSTMIEIMAGNWYLDTTLENKDKDIVDSIRSSIWVEFSEMTGMGKRDVDWLRSFLSRKVDCIRLSYDRRVQPFPRKCVFIGTINPSGDNMYLKDNTGNRRYWPIECNNIDLSFVKDNRHQLWAEAYCKYKEKAKYWIDDEDIDAIRIMRGMHSEREVESPLNRKVKNYLIGKNVVSMDELIQQTTNSSLYNKSPRELLSIQTTLGIIIRKIGWHKGVNEHRDKYYDPEKWDKFPSLTKENPQEEWGE